jgi:hypothetical protein
MLIPAELIPKEEGVAPGTPAPLDVKVKRVVVLSLFFGPFGAMAGLGIGLLLEGARQKLFRKQVTPGEPPAEK